MEDLGHRVSPEVNSGRIAVLGGGWAGLAAAVTLARAGRPVDVYEAARTLGGRARRVEIDGIALDNGQHILLGAYRDSLAIIRAAGGDPEKLLLRLPLELAFPGAFRLRAPRSLPAPLHLLVGLIDAQGLSFAEKFAAIRFMVGMQLNGFNIADDITVAELIRRHAQPPQVVRYLWEPLCIAALNTAIGDSSARIFLRVLRDAFTQGARDSDLLIPRADLGALFPDLAAAAVSKAGGRVRLGESVDSLAADASGWRIGSGTGAEHYAAVACALPPWRAADLLPPQCAHVAAQLRALAHEPILTCYLQYPPHTHLPRPMIGLSREISQWAFDRGQLDGPAGLVAVVVSAAGRLRGIDAAELAAAIHAELREVVPGLETPQWHRVISEKRATFKAAPGLSRPAAGLLLPGLALAGDFVDSGYPATIEGAVRSGIAAARALLGETRAA
ncbi:MAG: squalene-associated FAD-dependent desaturase [Betaproteobacteria bacterium]|nr:squalene-associated FAD-dependent desaturase [Betaproteobacteria bacterium]